MLKPPCINHPDVKAHARGLCNTCYRRWRYRNTPRVLKPLKVASFCINHPEVEAHCKGLCRCCYSKVSYVKNRLARIAQAKAYQRKNYVPHPLKTKEQKAVAKEIRTYFNDDSIPPVKEGVKFKYRPSQSWTKQDYANLDACLKRRGLDYASNPSIFKWQKAA